MTQIPWFDQLWYKSSFMAMFRRQTTGFSILKIVGEFVAQRREETKEQKATHKDMLSRFFEIQSSNASIPPW
jgi:hypothetical protein